AERGSAGDAEEVAARGWPGPRVLRVVGGSPVSSSCSRSSSGGSSASIGSCAIAYILSWIVFGQPAIQRSVQAFVADSAMFGHQGVHLGPKLIQLVTSRLCGFTFGLCQATHLRGCL